MFKGQETITFTTDKTLDAITDVVEDGLQGLGKVNVSKQGAIDVEPRSKYKTTFTEVNFEGSLEHSKKNPEQWSLTVSFDSKPTIACWIVAVLGTTMLCFGFLVLLIPFNAKKNVQRELTRALHRIQDELS